MIVEPARSGSRSISAVAKSEAPFADADADAYRFDETAHGVANWPFGGQSHRGTAHRDERPETLPDGNPWPRVRILTAPAPNAPGLGATVASVVGQAYPESRHDVLGPEAATADTMAALLADPAVDFLLVLRAGDLLAPGALASLCLEAVLSKADVVAGLRVVFDRVVLGLDVIAQAPGALRGSGALDGDLAPFTGGEVLLSRAAVRRAGGLDLGIADPVRALWPRLAATGARFARVGRPVLLQHAAAEAPSPRPAIDGASIVSLTDRGYSGGAGIGHRRLTEALALAGHRIVHVQLDREAAPAAAEWTDAFPVAEAEIRGGAHDLVLAGNLHGATRSLAILARLAPDVPVAVVMHDLFPVTGRCAFPGDCRVIATGCDERCPSPDAYPQLAPGRIAEAYAGKRDVLSGPASPVLLANSAWTARVSRDLAPPGTTIATIDLAFPTGTFRPDDRAELRKRLGLPADDVLVMVASVIVDAPGKGFADLADTLRRVSRPGVRVVAVGRLDDPTLFGIPDLIVAGPIGEEAVLAQWYGACDLYVTASRNETLGQTPIEAGLCGTPTVAYRASGLSTAVIDGVSGILVEPEAESLADAVDALIADAPRRQRLGAFARIALESRNSHAAAAMRLHDVLGEGTTIRLPSVGDRIRFTPETLGHFAFAMDRHPGSGGTVSRTSPAFVRRARRLKQAVLGRGLPLWLRRLLSLIGRLGKVAGRRR